MFVSCLYIYMGACNKWWCSAVKTKPTTRATTTTTVWIVVIVSQAKPAPRNIFEIGLLLVTTRRRLHPGTLPCHFTTKLTIPHPQFLPDAHRAASGSPNSFPNQRRRKREAPSSVETNERRPPALLVSQCAFVCVCVCMNSSGIKRQFCVAGCVSVCVSFD